MKILICPDKFKGSLTAREVCDAVSHGFAAAGMAVAMESVPLADGGEGTCDLLTDWHEGKRISLQVSDPLFRPVQAYYGIAGDGKTAFIEMAMASGLTLLAPEERNPLLTSSAGTGEMIADALARGVTSIIIGIGGSATNDAGMGMASALGYVFCDRDGEPLKPVGENLIHLHHIAASAINPRLLSSDFITLCDVQNPLYGPDGAAFVYGPQKGADKTAIELLDAGLRNFRRVVHKQLKTSVDFPGAGAAGGMGAGAKAFLNARMVRGINYVIDHSRIPEKIQEADLIITGEGKIDSQTLSGKVVSEVTALANKAGKPVVAVCGQSDLSAKQARTAGLSHIIPLVDDETSPETAMAAAAALLTARIAAKAKDLLNF